MKKDIYLLGHHLPSFSIFCMIATESLVAVSAACQLATSGVNGDDDEFRYPDPTRIIMSPSQYSIYNIKAPYL